MDPSIKKDPDRNPGPAPKAPPTPSTGSRRRTSAEAAQAEFLRDLRISIKQMQRGDVQPAREALQELRREFEADDDGSRSDE